MVFAAQSSTEIQHPLVRERKDVIEQDLEKVVLILGDDSKCLIPLISNFDPLLRDFDRVLTDLAQTEVSCRELMEKFDSSDLYIRTLKQQKKSLELRIVELEALHHAEVRRWNEDRKYLERRNEDLEWKIDQKDIDISRLSKVNSDLQKQLSSSAEQLQSLKKTRNITRKFSSAVRLVKQQKDADITQKIIKKLEEDSEQYTDRFNMMDSENCALARQLEETHDLIEELRLRDEMLNREKREWKVEREDLLEETVHLRAQLKILEADLNKHYAATKNLQAQIRKSEADVKSFECEAKKFSDENQLLESQMVRMKNIMLAEGIELEQFPELNIKIPAPGPKDKKLQEVKGGLLSVDNRLEISLQDELDLEDDRVRSRPVSESEELEFRNTQLEQEIMRIDTEKNVLLSDVRRAEKNAAGKDREIIILKDELKSLNSQITAQQMQLTAYEEQRGVMEDEQMKLAERIVRDSRARRSLRRSDSAISEPDSDINDNLFEENLQLMKEKQIIFEKYTQLEAEYLTMERNLKSEKLEAERKLSRLQEDYKAISESENKLTEELKEVKLKLDRLKCLYNLLQSEDNEGEDPEDLVARLKYKRGEVEALLRDRKEMRTQIVSLQKMINMRSSEEDMKPLNTGGIVARVMGALRKRRNIRTVSSTSALEGIAKTTSGVIGKDLGYSLIERGQKKRPSISTLSRGMHTTRRTDDLKELSSVPRKVANGWTYSPTGIFSKGLPPEIPVYSKLMILDDRPQRVICSCFIPHWPFPRMSGVKILLKSANAHNSSTESRDSIQSCKGSFEGRDSSNKSKDSSTRGSVKSIESKDSVRSTKSMDGKTNFPLIEEVVMGTDNVAMGMLCMSSLKPLTSVALNNTVITNMSNQLEDRMSAALFSQDIVKAAAARVPSSHNNTDLPGTRTPPTTETQILTPDVDTDCVPLDQPDTQPPDHGLLNDLDELEDEEHANTRRELFRQTRAAFLHKPVSSFRHKVSPNSRSLYPYLWVVAADEQNLSFLHVINLNFPVRVTRTHFLCEGKVQALAVVKNNAVDTEEQIRAKKVLFGSQQSGKMSSCWMGTADGRLFIIELREPHQQVFSKKLSDSVLQIRYSEPNVYVSLKNGALVVFSRYKDGTWDMDNYQLIVIDTTGRKVRKITEIADKVWCGSGPTISIYDINSYRVIEKVDVVMNNNERIREIVYIGGTVWVSLSGSTKIVIIAAQTKELIRVISLKGYLLRTGRRHGLDLQETEMYITTMFYDGNLVWVGTNIGVILTVAFPVSHPDLSNGRSSNLSSVDDELAWDSNDNMLSDTMHQHAVVSNHSDRDGRHSSLSKQSDGRHSSLSKQSDGRHSSLSKQSDGRHSSLSKQSDGRHSALSNHSLNDDSCYSDHEVELNKTRIVTSQIGCTTTVVTSQIGCTTPVLPSTPDVVKREDLSQSDTNHTSDCNHNNTTSDVNLSDDRLLDGISKSAPRNRKSDDGEGSVLRERTFPTSSSVTLTGEGQGTTGKSKVPFEKDSTFDYEDPKQSVSNMSEDIEEMLASFDIDANIRQSVHDLNEDHILFSMYGNQGPSNYFCRVEGDDELPSLLCAGGIGFDDYEVKGLKNLRRKVVITAESPADPNLLSQLLMWTYSR